MVAESIIRMRKRCDSYECGVPERARRSRNFPAGQYCSLFLLVITFFLRVEPAMAQNPAGYDIMVMDEVEGCPQSLGSIPARRAPAHFRGEVVAAYPHDTDAFTQGLIWLDGTLYESTGRLGQSTLRQVDLTSGVVTRIHHLPDTLFGEGLTDWNGLLIQLTLHAGKALVYDRESFALRRIYRYEGEGWGLTSDRHRLILSDGSPFLRFYDPSTFRKIGERQITDREKPLEGLNELQMVGELLYANILFEDKVAIIDPDSGIVAGWLHLGHLLSEEEREPPVNVLNGIAFDPEAGRLFVTGKLWPSLFEIRCTPIPAEPH